MAANIALAVFMVVGAVGSLFPGFPGTWVVGLSLLVHGVLTGFAQLPTTWLFLGIALLILAEASEFLVSASGAKKFGARRPGIIGALVGSLAGVLLLGPLGIVAGPLLGAVAGEMLTGRPLNEALAAGFGATLGVLGGAFAKFVIVTAVVVIMLIKLF